MAYETKNLSVLAYANGFTLWHYTTTDPVTTVSAAGYFNGAADMVRVGDLLLTNADTDATISADIFLVRTNTGGAVGVVNIT